MKKSLVFLGIILVSTLLYAGTYSITTTAGQDTRIERERVRINKTECNAVNLPNTCTQAQCRNLNQNCNIYTSIADLLDRKVVKDYADSLRSKDTSDDNLQFCAWWNSPTTTNTDRNVVCSKSGLPNGCEVCQ